MKDSYPRTLATQGRVLRLRDENNHEGETLYLLRVGGCLTNPGNPGIVRTGRLQEVVYVRTEDTWAKVEDVTRNFIYVWAVDDGWRQARDGCYLDTEKVKRDSEMRINGKDSEGN